MTDFNQDHDAARSLHRIVRAMHDGECPSCHRLWDSGQMRRGSLGDHQCPTCLFTITREESEAVMRIFAEFMDRNLAVFLAWRESLKGQECSQ